MIFVERIPAAARSSTRIVLMLALHVGDECATERGISAGLKRAQDCHQGFAQLLQNGSISILLDFEPPIALELFGLLPTGPHWGTGGL